MSMVKTIRSALLGHKQKYFTLDEAVEIIMSHLTERYIPKYKFGGNCTMTSVEFNNMNVLAANDSYELYGIMFYCEDGHVCYADTDKEPERSHKNGTKKITRCFDNQELGRMRPGYEGNSREPA